MMPRAASPATIVCITFEKIVGVTDRAGIHSDVQHVETCVGTRGVAGGGSLRNCSRRIRTSTDRGAEERDPLRMPLGLYGALRERHARRRGSLSMPAEEHVRPVVGMQTRGPRGRPGCGAEDQSCAKAGGSTKGGPPKEGARACRPEG